MRSDARNGAVTTTPAIRRKTSIWQRDAAAPVDSGGLRPVELRHDGVVR
jgi:hypothetical protein